MLRIGFLTEIVEDAALETRLKELTDTLSSMAPIALLGVKKHLNLIARGVLQKEEIERQVLFSERSHDIAEGARAWKEKRPPKFTGT